MARHAKTRAEVTFVEIDHPFARRVLSLHHVADAEMPAAVDLMHACLIERTWQDLSHEPLTTPSTD